jgi:hypothetical protein
MSLRDLIFSQSQSQPEGSQGASQDASDAFPSQSKRIGRPGGRPRAGSESDTDDGGAQTGDEEEQRPAKYVTTYTCLPTPLCLCLWLQHSQCV